MSLTTILADRKVLLKLKEYFPLPNINFESKLKAPPLTTNYSLVGTAFDYLLRFYLDHHNKGKIIQRYVWVADTAFNMIVSHLTNPRLIGVGKTKFFRMQSNVRRDKQELVKLISTQYGEAKANYLAYHSDGHLTDDLIASTLFLARLDCYYRSSASGRIDFFEPIEPDDIEDLRLLMSLVVDKQFAVRKKCHLNPNFGKASDIVGGADADVVIDNTLIEIKVVKALRSDRKYFDQLLGYYILSLIGGLNGKGTDFPIKNIGIYFARHQYLWSIPISNVGSKKQFALFKNWFAEYVKKNYTFE